MEYVKLSICDVIVSQKGSNGDGKLHFFGRDYILLALVVKKIPLGQRGILIWSFDIVTKRGEHGLVTVCVRYEGTKC